MVSKLIYNFLFIKHETIFSHFLKIFISNMNEFKKHLFLVRKLSSLPKYSENVNYKSNTTHSHIYITKSYTASYLCI